METRRWVNQSQPQTLQIAVILLYITAVFTLLFHNDGLYELAFLKLTRDADTVNLLRNLARLLVVPGGVAAGYFIANERKWGYALGIVVAALPLITTIYVCAAYSISPLDLDLLDLLFDVALFGLIVHPQSREYQRIWFK